MDAVKLTLLLPFVGTITSLFLRNIFVGLSFSLATLISSLFIPIGYTDKIILSEQVGLSISLHIDGLNLPLIILTTGLFFLVFLYATVEKRERKDEYIFLFLLLEAFVIPTFLTQNLLIFYFFFDAILIPMFFIIGIWGTGKKVYSAYKFVLFTFFGGVFLLICIIYIGKEVFAESGKLSFELEDFVEVCRKFDYNTKILLFLGFFLAFAVKIPLIPLHVWLPDAHTEAPTGGSVILAGILLKIGSYAFLRFAIPLFPDIVKDYYLYISYLSVIGIIFGAILALSQNDIKRLIAYSSVSHMGYVMLGSVAFSSLDNRLVYEGLQGAILQMINHGIATGALFFLVGMLYERTHTRMISDYSGIASRVPILTFFFMIFTLSSIGFPSTGGFIGEILVILGAIKSNVVVGIITAAGAILSAGYMLYLILRVFFGEYRENKATEHLDDIKIIEIITLIPLAIFVFLIGIYPKPLMGIISNGIEFIWRSLQ